ncbi:glycosyltransferase [Modestobacter sp. Leaf380]|uniref:glycosyltransferase n=1 Tax=Modestobacter sp. Leaf380 TaxID=1736356 RepID=UPI0006F6C90C|nr:glycosyltransferase [Modestobacter sp. Leaf380]KQS68244.1 glycosyl transferase [Modestobacter sp. Leaf380]
MNVLVWHVHGSWLTALVQGPHRYLVPVVPDRSGDGLGRARTWDWPSTVVEVTPEELRDTPVDVVVLQRPRDLELLRAWTGWEPGVDVPAVYVEHDTPPAPADSRHLLADRTDVPLVHVTHFNRVAWDAGRAPVHVVEHGVVDPGHRWTGELARAAVVTNDPVTRGRTVGTDLIAPFAPLGVDVFGMRVTGLSDALGVPVGEFEDLPQDVMHDELARRRVYLHLTRWTSLGLSLVEAMTMGVPVVVLAATEAPTVVPAGAGVVAADVDALVEGARRLLADPDAARAAGEVARAAALERFGLERFLTDLDAVLEGVAR